MISLGLTKTNQGHKILYWLNTNNVYTTITQKQLGVVEVTKPHGSRRRQPRWLHLVSSKIARMRAQYPQW